MSAPWSHYGRTHPADPHTQTRHQLSSSRSPPLAMAGPGHPVTDMRSLDKAPLYIELAGRVRQLADVDTPAMLPQRLVEDSPQIAQSKN